MGRGAKQNLPKREKGSIARTGVKVVFSYSGIIKRGVYRDMEKREKERNTSLKSSEKRARD